MITPLGRRERFLLGAALAGVVALLLMVGLAIPVVGFY